MVFDWKIVWVRSTDKGRPIPILDCISASIHKSTEIKNNICTLNLKNSPNKLASDGSTIIGEYVDSATHLLKFNEEDQFQIWATFLTDASEVDTDWYDSARSFGTFSLREFTTTTDTSGSKIMLKAVDTAFLLFNQIYTFSYGISNNYTAPGIIRHCARKFGEANPATVTTELGTAPDDGTEYAIDAKYTSEGGYIQDIRRKRTGVDPNTYTNDQTTLLSAALTDIATTISVNSTTGFEAPGTLVIGTEHISYTGVNGTQFTTCTRGIDDTVASTHANNATVYQGYPLLLFSKIWKPLFEWIGELSQTENTNYLAETQEGGTLYHNRAFMFWIDKDNKPHWFYPDDEVDLTVDLAEEGRRGFRLQKSVFDAVNFIVYNCGEDMYGNGIIHYHYDDKSDVASMKMRYQPMSKIIFTLMQEDIDYDSTRGTTRETDNQDIFKNFWINGDYPEVPTFLGDANNFWSSIGSSTDTDVDDDTEYNAALRAAAKWRGLIEARKITSKRAGLRYRGSIAIKGAHVNPGDLIQTTNPFSGLVAQKLRVLGVTHQINKNKWESILKVEEDEKVEA